MSQPSQSAANRLGPFPAGSTSADLVALVAQGDLGLRVLDAEEQARDYYKARCEAIEKVAQEFFFAYPGSKALILQKVRDSALLPEFAEYVYCWFADDRLCGAILSGVTSDAGTHAQVNEQEAASEQHAAEVAEALGRKYPEQPGRFVNFFDFEILPAPPAVEGSASEDLHAPFERLATQEESEPCTRVETAYCGPSLVSFVGRPLAAEIPTGSTHSAQSSRKAYANPDCLVIYDYKLERYVRTIESIHVYETLIYVSRSLNEDLGRRLNARQAQAVREQAAAAIDEWRQTIERAENARRDRIDRLAAVL